MRRRPLPTLILIFAVLAAGLTRPRPAAAQTPATPAPLLTLERALALAALGNETPGIAAARVDRAEAVRREAYATLFPALTVSTTFTRRAREVTRLVNDEELVIQALNAVNSQAVLDATLFDARAIPGVRAARENLAAQRLESGELNRILAFDVAEAYYAVLSAERLRAAAARRAEVATATVSDASIRRDAGLAALNDVTRSELELATARLLLTQSESGIRASRLTLGYLIGLPVGTLLTQPLVEPDDSAAEPRESPESPESTTELDATTGVPAGAGTPESAALEAAALRGRADLQALRDRAEALRLIAQEPLLRTIPTLGLRGTMRETNEAGLTGRERDWNLAATLSWELFDGGDRYAQADQRRAAHREALLQARALERRIGLEVQSALAAIETARAALEQAEVRARVAAQNADEIRERFGQGLASALERADATASRFEAEAEVERQRFDLRLAELALRQALGRGPRPGLEPAGDDSPATAKEE